MWLFRRVRRPEEKATGFDRLPTQETIKSKIVIILAREFEAPAVLGFIREKVQKQIPTMYVCLFCGYSNQIYVE